MSSTKTAVRPSAADLLIESFRAHGRPYRWQEGASVVRSHSVTATPRAGQSALFIGSVVPQIESRGARGLVFLAPPPRGWDREDVRWVAWRAPSDEAPVWGLYAATRRLLGAGHPQAPANDAFTLVAWGDGNKLMWADERATARAGLRTALRSPPAWLARGMRSHDASFPVRIDPIGAGDRPVPVAAACVAVVRPATGRVTVSGGAASQAEALEVLRAWRKSRAPGNDNGSAGG